MATSFSNTPGLAAAVSLENDSRVIIVIIKFSGNKTYNIGVSSKDTVRDLKDLVAIEANISSSHINLVLCGQLLSDDSVIEDCGLGAFTTVHAFLWSDDGLGSGDVTFKNLPSRESGTQQVKEMRKSVSRESDVDGERESDVDGEVTSLENQSVSVGSDVDCALPHREGTLLGRKTSNGNVKQNEHHRFFVFCKICECVRPAKLRLSCKECGNGAFILGRGPSNWDDISSETAIRGTCCTQKCTCETPRFFLRCSQSHGDNVEGTAVVLKHVQANRRRVACIICEDVLSHVLIFPCSSGHVICLECFRQYGSTCLSERRFIEHPQHGYTLPCPAGCVDSHIEESHHFCLLGAEKYEHYKNFGAEEYVLQNGGILCPAPGCGMGLFPEGNERLIRCRECRFESCRECRRAHHIGPCEENLESLRRSLSDMAVNDERAQRACWETQSLSLIEETTKACPGCHTKTERSGGCMHMVCTRCPKEWCWVCVKPWDRDCQADHWFG